jgi:sigma-E factor negative regulatory protein RseA
MKSRVSELMDGELVRDEAQATLLALREEGEAREAWRAYHLISDALHDTRMLSPGFAERLAERVAAEPTVLAPLRSPQTAPPRAQWVVLTAAASVAAVTLVGSLAFVTWQDQGSRVPMAQAPRATPATVAEPVRVPPPAAADDYLLAHQRYSPRNSLQGMAPYVRTVSGETRARKP